MGIFILKIWVFFHSDPYLFQKGCPAVLKTISQPSVLQQHSGWQEAVHARVVAMKKLYMLPYRAHKSDVRPYFVRLMMLASGKRTSRAAFSSSVIWPDMVS